MGIKMITMNKTTIAYVKKALIFMIFSPFYFFKSKSNEFSEIQKIENGFYVNIEYIFFN